MDVNLTAYSTNLFDVLYSKFKKKIYTKNGRKFEKKIRKHEIEKKYYITLCIYLCEFTWCECQFVFERCLCLLWLVLVNESDDVEKVLCLWSLVP